MCDYEATAEVWLVPVDVVTEEEFNLLNKSQTLYSLTHLVDNKWQQYKTDSNVIEEHIIKVYFI